MLNTDTHILDPLSRFSSLIKVGREDKKDHRGREEGKGSWGETENEWKIA